jgi:hypothetical protein
LKNVRGSQSAKSTTALLAIFLGWFGLFALRAEFFHETSLVLAGRADGPATLVVGWDSGSVQVPMWTQKVEVPSGDFQTTVHLPAQPLLSLSLEPATSIDLRSAELRAGPSSVALQGFPRLLSRRMLFDVTDFARHRYPPFLIVFQLCLSAFCTYLVYVFLFLADAATLRKRLHRAFVAERRFVFWSMVLFASAAHALWLLAFWPAAMTNDSWSTVAEALGLRFSAWQPYAYTLYVLALMQFWNSVASVALFQIVATASLVSYVLFYSLRRGVPWVVVGACYLFYVCSIPVGLMNVMVWKDVPFSLAVLGFCFLMYRVQIARETRGALMSPPLWSYPLCAVFGVLLCHSRHNGAVFYLLTPLLLFGRVRWRDYTKLVLLCVALFLAGYQVLPRVLGVAGAPGSPYHEVRTALAIMTHPTFFSSTREEDRATMERYLGMPWSEIEQLYPQHWFTINDRGVARHQYSPTLGYDAQYNKAFLFRIVTDNLPIFLSARTFDFLHSISIDSSHSDHRNGFFEDPHQLTGSNLAPPGNVVFNVALEASAPVPWIRARLHELDRWARQYDGLVSPQVIIWSLALPLVAFFAILFFERGLSAISLFILPGLAAAGVVFLMGAGESWRYFYFLYLQWLVVLPLYWAYKRDVSGRRLRPVVARQARAETESLTIEDQSRTAAG